jgi:hypothetical protein
MADQFSDAQLKQITDSISDGISQGFTRIDFGKLIKPNQSNDKDDSDRMFQFNSGYGNYGRKPDGILASIENALFSKQGDIQGFYGNILSATTGIGGLIPGLGKLSEVVNDLGTSGLRYLLESNEAFKFLSKSGAGFNGDLMKIRKTSADLNMDLADFTNFISRNSESLAVLGGTVDSGADKIAGYYQSLLDTGVIERFKRLGYTAEESAEFVAKNMSQQARAMYVQGLSEEERNDQMSRYAKNLQILAKLTGQDVDALEEKLRNENLAGEEIAKNRMLEKRGIAGVQTSYNTFKQMFEDMPDLQRLITQLYTRQAPLDDVTQGLTSTLPTVTAAIQTALHNIETGTGNIFEDSALIQGKLQEALDRDSVLQTAILGNASSATQGLADLLVQGDKQSQKLAALRLQEEYKGLDNAQILSKLYSDANKETRKQMETGEGLQNTMNELDKAQRATISTVQNQIVAIFQSDQIKTIAEEIRITASNIPESLKNIETPLKQLGEGLGTAVNIFSQASKSLFEELQLALLDPIKIKEGDEIKPKDIYAGIKKDIDNKQTTNLEKFKELGILIKEQDKDKKEIYTLNPELELPKQLIDRLEPKLSQQSANPDDLLEGPAEPEESRKISIQGLEELTEQLSNFPDISKLAIDLANKNKSELEGESVILSNLLKDTTQNIKTIIESRDEKDFSWDKSVNSLLRTLQQEVEGKLKDDPENKTLNLLKQKLTPKIEVSVEPTKLSNTEDVEQHDSVGHTSAIGKNTIAIEGLTEKLATTDLNVSIANPKVTVDTTELKTVLNTLVKDSTLQVANNTTKPTEEKDTSETYQKVEKTNDVIKLGSPTSDQTDKDFQVSMLAQMKRTNELLQKQNRHLESLFTA